MQQIQPPLTQAQSTTLKFPTAQQQPSSSTSLFSFASSNAPQQSQPPSFSFASQPQTPIKQQIDVQSNASFNFKPAPSSSDLNSSALSLKTLVSTPSQPQIAAPQPQQSLPPQPQIQKQIQPPRPVQQQASSQLQAPQTVSAKSAGLSIGGQTATPQSSLVVSARSAAEKIKEFTEQLNELKTSAGKLFDGKELASSNLLNYSVLKKSKQMDEKYARVNADMQSLSERCVELRESLLTDFRNFEKLRLLKHNVGKSGGNHHQQLELDPITREKYENVKKLYAYICRELPNIKTYLDMQKKRKQEYNIFVYLKIYLYSKSGSSFKLTL